MSVTIETLTACLDGVERVATIDEKRALLAMLEARAEKIREDLGLCLNASRSTLGPIETKGTVGTWEIEGGTVVTQG